MKFEKNALKLIVSTTEVGLVKELLLDELNKKNGRIEFSDGSYLESKQRYQPSSRFTSFPEILEFAINIVSGIGVGLFTAWIYDKIKNRKNTKVDIQGIDITLIDKESMEELISRLISDDNNT